DQGGCFENSRPTTHQDPTSLVGDKIYYCVSNMPGAVPQTSTAALPYPTLPYIQRITSQRWQRALSQDAVLAAGLNAHNGQLVHRGVYDAMVDQLDLEAHRDFRPVQDVLARASREHTPISPLPIGVRDPRWFRTGYRLSFLCRLEP